MISKLQSLVWNRDDSIDMTDYNKHPSPSGEYVVYCCPGCGSPKIRYVSGENPKWMCTNSGCPYNRKENGGKRTSIWNNSTWKLDRYTFTEYEREFL